MRKFYTQSNLNNNTPKKAWVLVSILSVLLLGCFLLSIMIGSKFISLPQIADTLRTGDSSSTVYQILFYVRVPRTVAAILAGSAMAVSGVILQSVLGNPLASPNLVGVNAGAGLFSILLIALFPGSILWSPVAAFIGAILASLFIYLLAYKTGASRLTLILAGISITSILGAVTDTILTLFPETQISRMSFLIGSFSGVTTDMMGLSLLLIPIGLVFAMLLRYDLNMLALGDDTARSLGHNVSLYRFASLGTASLLAGSAVSFSGLLGFVGLIIPHLGRFFTGHDNRLLVPVSALLGAVFTLLCDMVARTIFAPYEIPVGIIMSLLGGPFFLYLLIKKKRGHQYDSSV